MTQELNIPQTRLQDDPESSLGRLPGSPPAPGTDPIRLAYLVSHPIQYQVPLLRRIARDPGLELTVFFGSDFSMRGYHDQGFGVDVKWDIPLLDGYRHEFLPALRDNGTQGIFAPVSYGILRRLARGSTGPAGRRPFDALWVHGYSTVNQLHGILAAKMLGIPVLVRSDSSLQDRPRGGTRLAAKKVFFALLRHLVHGILVSGTWNQQYWRYYMGPEFPLHMLPYAVDNEWFQSRCAEARQRRPELQAALGLDPSRPVILFASKMQSRKHCGDLITAYARLAPGPGLETEPYLLLVGDGEERAELEQLAHATGLPGIRFCGFKNQSELPAFFDLATVFVLPAKHEPWGLVVNEVMNAGVPVIVTDETGCHPDLVTQGIEGIVYPARDLDALEAALRAVLTPPGKAAAMGRNALARIRQWSFEEDMAGLRQALTGITRRNPWSTRTWSTQSEPKDALSAQNGDSTA